MTYSIDFRRKVLEVRTRDRMSLAKVSKMFGVSIKSVVTWEKRLEAKKTRRGGATKIDMEALKKDIELYPDAYQYERAKRFNVSRHGIWYALKKLNVSYKKTLKHPKANEEKRSAFCQTIKDFKEKARSIVFLDESGFAHDMPRTHGYAVKGEKCFGTQDWGAKGRTNVIGALIGKVLLTVSLFNTNVNTDVFNAWVSQDLIPKLPKTSVVVMDNATFHKSIDMQKEIKDAGHTLLYLPPYSPDLNPIEKKWAEVKSLRRKTGCSINDLFKDQKL